MAQFERKHVSKLIPADHRLLMPLLLAVTIVNSAVRIKAGTIYSPGLQLDVEHQLLTWQPTRPWDMIPPS